MRNLIIGLVVILLALLAVVAGKHFLLRNSSEPSTEGSSIATPLSAPSAAPEKSTTAVEASLKEASAKREAAEESKSPESKPQATKTGPSAKLANADQIASSGDKEKAVRAYAVLLEEATTKTNPWIDAELEIVREKHAAAVRDLLFNPANDWRSKKVTVASGDSLERIRKHVVEAAGAKPVTVGMIRKANRLSKDIIHPGQVLRVPQDAMKVIVDRAAYSSRVYFGDLLVGFYRVGLGQPDTPTPTGVFVVGEKQKNPTWFPRGEKPVGYGDPNNPLGSRWIALKQNGVATSYGIHGTNKDEAVGASITQGCVRMYNKDVEDLYEILPEGSSVEIR